MDASVTPDRASIPPFERAVEAIISGDAATLRQLLREEPALIRARSTRPHRATLLHFVAANGVEDERQRTPANAVEIAQILLDAGAEVDAEADMYGGGCTTLGLVATSVHPEAAGVQNALMQTLIDSGAVIDRPRGVGRDHAFVNGCLANGRAAAAEYLASRGARLDLAAAAGIGRLDIVASFFNDNGTLEPPAANEARAALDWACAYGRTAVAAWLLDRGVPAGAAGPNGQTCLHSAALGGHAPIIRLLLARGAPIDVVEQTYGGTPLTWGLFGWSHAAAAARNRYDEAIALLVAAGAAVNPAWFDERHPTVFGEAIRADPRMRAALRGEMPPE